MFFKILVVEFSCEVCVFDTMGKPIFGKKLCSSLLNIFVISQNFVFFSYI